MGISEALNLEFIDRQYRQWKDNPESMSRDWQLFFEGFQIGHDGGSGESEVRDRESEQLQAKVEALKYRYRDLGHLLACMDPLLACPTEHPLLDISAFGIDPEILNRSFFTRRLTRTGNPGRVPLHEIIQTLKETYCRSVGVEYMHLQDPGERQWLQERMEPVRNHPETTPEDKRRILERLQEAALFEAFLNKKYVAVTRFSLEGGEAVIPMLDALVEKAAGHGCSEIILGMAHRGRLNVQAHILKKTYTEIFSEFENCYDPESLIGAGDVKYHNGYLADIETSGGQPMRILLVNNPSHLEAVNPVVEGISRARQDMAGPDRSADRVLPLLVHGDAAFAGQGVVFETLNMSQLDGYGTGGTVHLIVNNQIGYTTLPEDARSTRYATDVAKMLMVPIFHVHGEDPEAAVHVMRLALDYRMQFKKDVVVDVVCYRKYGHNEGDEPYFTQPQMYDRIRQRPSLHRLYAQQVETGGATTESERKKTEVALEKKLKDAFEDIHGSSCLFPELRFFENWKGFHGNGHHDIIRTGVPKAELKALAASLNRSPDGFSLNRKLKGLMEKRLEAVENESGIDWANAEALAFASLVTQGVPVRLSGQDCGRGTFSQRHSVLFDTQTGEKRTPLNTLREDQAPFEVFNSLLAEYAVLGFEYGYTLTRPDVLTLWEAQFGDFVNNAQSVIDLFIASGQSKWQRLSGLTLLLPHGCEGLGPEHSSARPERFLQLCAEDNMIVCNPSTPAQYFHLLRRQVIGKVRKPLVILTPKSLLRHPVAVSDLSALSDGHFEEIIADPGQTRSPKRMVFCSGKIYYELLERRETLNRNEIAIMRVEQFYPFPAVPVREIAGKYDKIQDWCWVQEEPENMGGWRFIQPLIEAETGRPLAYIGRPAAASPATGFPHVFRKEQSAIVDRAMHFETKS